MEIEAYRQFADLEEDHWWFRARRSIFFHLLDRELPQNAGLQLLDLGCGAGQMLKPLSRYGHARGLEPHLDSAHLAHERSGAPMICASGYALPFASDSQDVVCLFDTLEHVPDEARALQEVYRVMKPGGLGFVSGPAYQFLWTNNDRVSHHCRRYTVRGLRRSLVAAGFEPTRSTYFNTLLFPAILPALLLQKLRERWIGLSNPDHTNLTVQTPGLVSELLFRCMSSERHLLTRMSFPAGHSLIVIVRKPSAPAD